MIRTKSVEIVQKLMKSAVCGGKILQKKVVLSQSEGMTDSENRSGVWKVESVLRGEDGADEMSQSPDVWQIAGAVLTTSVTNLLIQRQGDAY